MNQIIVYKRIIPSVFLAGVFSLLISCGNINQEKSSSTNNKVEALVEKMTLKEKIGQMTQICFGIITESGTKKLELDTSKFRQVMQDYQVGSFLSGTGSAKEWSAFTRLMQDIALEESSLDIPLLIGIDHVHGSNYVNEGTIFPHNILLSCSFDSALVANAAAITAKETAMLGLTWNFSPVIDLGKNPYWPRFYETYGEDPLLTSVLGSANIHAYQQNIEGVPYSLAACGKHFIGYSDPETGWDRTPADISDQTMAECFMPPFQKAIDAGVHTIMVNSGEVNGMPVHTSKPLLDDLLRKRMGFEGVILTDIKDIQKVVDMHSGASDFKQAVLYALQAGIDVNMACTSFEFIHVVEELVKEGKVTEERINQSVRRILKMKMKLGLFDQPYPAEADLSVVGSEDHRQLAERTAAESIVLLKNQNNILPFSREIDDIALAGFAANSKKILNGAWTYEWMGASEERQPENMHTLFSAMKQTFPGKNISLLSTPDFTDSGSMNRFHREAREADAIVLTLGEKLYSEFKGNIDDLHIAEKHQKLFELAESTGKPVVVILIEGRPRVINSINESASAVLFAGYPGQRGADAMAKIFSGKVNPSGRLSFTYPSAVGHTPNYYRKPSQTYKPLYPFGHGLSYTDYRYTDLQLSDTVFTDPAKKITASVTVKNTGNRDGRETVLWYIRDKAGKITRPVKQLKHFEKSLIPKGTSKTFTFEFTPGKVLSYPRGTDSRVLEKGVFHIMAGDMKKRLHYK